MTLQEAIDSGKSFARATDADLGEFFSAAEFLESGLTLADYTATDYVLEPETAAVTIKESILIEAWNATKPGSVKVAGASDFYQRLKASLKSKGVIISA